MRDEAYMGKTEAIQIRDQTGFWQLGISDSEEDSGPFVGMMGCLNGSMVRISWDRFERWRRPLQTGHQLEGNKEIRTGNTDFFFLKQTSSA
jgi:hypothetical protein